MSDKLAELKSLLHRRTISVSRNVRLYLIFDNDYVYINDGHIQTGGFESFAENLTQDRGRILEKFATMEFLITELIRLKILGFEFEKSEMLIDMISAINVNRRIGMLKEWGIIDDELKKNFLTLLEVRNALAHKFTIYEINYKNQRLVHPTNNNRFEQFRVDMQSVWNRLLIIYEQEERKIDLDRLIQQIQSNNSNDSTGQN